MSTIADLSFIRVVCDNTLQAAVGLNGANAAIRIPHITKITPARMQEIKGKLGILDDWIGNWETDVNKLADTGGLDTTDAVNFFVEVFGKRDDDGKLLEIQDQAKSLEAIVNKLVAYWKNGPGSSLVSANGTAWGLVNAVTGYVDHETRARSDESRFNSGQYGAGKRLKAKAFEEGLRLAA